MVKEKMERKRKKKRREIRRSFLLLKFSSGAICEMKHKNTKCRFM